MTLTVVDGDFPREVLAKENLTFANFDMPTAKNTPRIYNAVFMQAAPQQRGIVLVSAPGVEGDVISTDGSLAANTPLDTTTPTNATSSPGESSESSDVKSLVIAGIIGVLLIGLIFGGWILGSRSRG
ncbi:MAG: hypothetical protein IH991_00425 [Planctomycetes bacterium]|nr:hypothetical protein [Planctomycetota bacterium]